MHIWYESKEGTIWGEQGDDGGGVHGSAVGEVEQDTTRYIHFIYNIYEYKIYSIYIYDVL